MWRFAITHVEYKNKKFDSRHCKNVVAIWYDIMEFKPIFTPYCMYDAPCVQLIDIYFSHSSLLL